MKVLKERILKDGRCFPGGILKVDNFINHQMDPILIKYMRRIITPLVSGIVVTLIGLSLIKVGITACGGGEAAKAAGTFGSIEYVGLAALVLALIIFFNRSSNHYLRMSFIVIGLAIGYVVSWAMGMVNFSDIPDFGNLNIPIPFKYGVSFDLSAIVSLGLVYLITAIEAYGDITANSLISGQPVEGEKFMKRASGGILADGFNSMLAGIRIIASQDINRKATLVIAISFSFGLSVELVPEILSQLPETVRNIFSSGITTGGVMAILTNALIQIKED